MRRRVLDTREKSPPAPLCQRGEKFRDARDQAFPPLEKGGQGGFSIAGNLPKVRHAP